MLKGSERKEHNEIWLNHLDIELDYLNKKKQRIERRIGKYNN